MQTDRAVEHLQVIRTLMERSAIYRRALAPIMLLLGILAVIAAAIGLSFANNSPRTFGAYWLTVSILGLSGAYWMVRRQAVRATEKFWSPPTRRVTQAFLPPLFVGLIVTLVILLRSPDRNASLWWLPPLWMLLYGCALHAAGFFMPRGIKLFGWGFILAGCVALAFCAKPLDQPPLRYAHLLMGVVFGGFHLAYGSYLYFSESGKKEA